MRHPRRNPNQVVWNRLTNAIEFTPPRGVVTVRIEGEMHAGSIRAHSAGENAGATFSIVLPASRAESVALNSRGKIPSHPPGTERSALP